MCDACLVPEGRWVQPQGGAGVSVRHRWTVLRAQVPEPGCWQPTLDPQLCPHL